MRIVAGIASLQGWRRRIDSVANEGGAPGPWSDAHPHGGRASLIFGIAGATWSTAHGLGLLGPLQSITFVLLGTATSGAIVVALRRHRPPPQWPWWVIGAALVVFVIGGAARQ